MADQLSTNLISELLEFASRVKEKWSLEMESIEDANGLHERDLLILEWLSLRENSSFSQAVEYGTILDCQSGGKSESAVTAAISKMSKKFGLIKATRNKHDERSKTLAITPKGKDLVTRRINLRTAFFKKAATSLGDGLDKRTMTQLILCLQSAEL